MEKTKWFLVLALVFISAYALFFSVYHAKVDYAKADEGEEIIEKTGKVPEEPNEEGESNEEDEVVIYTSTFNVTLSVSALVDTATNKYFGRRRICYTDNVVEFEIVSSGKPVEARINGGFWELYGWYDDSKAFDVSVKVLTTGKLKKDDASYLPIEYKNFVTDIPDEVQNAVDPLPEVPEEPKEEEPAEDVQPIDKDELLNELIGKVDALIKEKESEGLDKLWEIIRPFVVYVLSAVLSGTVVAAIISAAIKKKYDTQAIAKEVLQNLASKDISVDIETMTRKEIAAIGSALKSNLKDGLAGVESMKRSVALLCGALSKSKTLTPEERAELAAEAKNLDETVKMESREKVVVRLEKTTTKETEEPAEKSTGLFDYLQ